MSGFVPPGHRHFIEVRDEIGQEAMRTDLASGVLTAVIWAKNGDLHDVRSQHWLSEEADRTLRNGYWGGVPYRHRGGYAGTSPRETLLIREKKESPARMAVKKNKGGNPGKWDWAGAAAFAAAYVAENDYPDRQSVLVKALADWFGAEHPDSRQIERFVKRLYDARIELETHRRSGTT